MVRSAPANRHARLALLVLVVVGSGPLVRTQAVSTPQSPGAATTATAGVRQIFRGLLLRTHPNRDAAASQVYLQHADEIVMDDGVRVENWEALAANIGTTGAGGLDVGSKAASTWYEIHAIRSSRTGARNLLLHRAKTYREDQSQPRPSGAENLRDTAERSMLARGFQVGVRGRVEFIDVSLRKNGSPPGSVWLTIESGAGAAVAESDRLDATKLPGTPTFIRFIFRASSELAASTEYRLVLHGDFAIHPANHVTWLDFKVHVTQNDEAVVMPEGYDERAKIGYVYNNEDGSLNGFVATDREVMPLVWAGTGDFPDKSPRLFDLRAFIPPGAIRLELSAANTQAPNRVIAGPVPAGFDARASDFNRGEGGQTSVMVTVSSDAQSILLGRMITEYQAGYFFTTGGRARVYISMWVW